jgi:hypothetical protein
MAPLPGAAPASLPAPWQLPFELAWEALRAGSRPVGAMLYDPEGQAVTAGRNRRTAHCCTTGRVREWRAAGVSVSRPSARFGGLLVRLWEVRYGPQRSPEGAGAWEARRLLDAGVLTAPTAEAAYALIAPSLVG